MKVQNKKQPNEEQIKGFIDSPEVGPISMVNLLKFKDKAEYSDNRETSLTGREAYLIYAKEVVAHVERFGGTVVFSKNINRLMLGEVEELWDMVAIAKYPNRKALLEMSLDSEYLKSHIHREAGLDGQLNIETINI